MLRFLYRCILGSHPAAFRRRFGDEMLSIFDQARSPVAAAALLVDAALSLLRQWVLRPQFAMEPVAVAASDGVPMFFTFGNRRPRSGALLDGALAALLVLNGVCWTMGYAWDHPVFIEIRRPIMRPPASMGKPAALPGKSMAAEPPLYTDQGRVLLVFKSPAPKLPESPAANPLPVEPADQPAGLLQPYIGTYRGDSAEFAQVRISEQAGLLQLDVAGRFTCLLAPVSEIRFAATGLPNCQVEFVRSDTGAVERVEINRGGRRITATRQ